MSPQMTTFIGYHMLCEIVKQKMRKEPVVQAGTEV